VYALRPSRGFAFLGVVASIGATVSACSQVPSKAAADLPCYDGWQASHQSYLWQPDEIVRAEVARQLPADRLLVCFHRFRIAEPPLIQPGELVVLSTDSGGGRFADVFLSSGQSVRYIRPADLYTLQ